MPGGTIRLLGEEMMPGKILMLEKKLTASDIDRGQNRMLVAGSQRLMAALTAEERRMVELASLGVETSVENGAGGRSYALQLKRWSSSGSVVLIHEWGELVRENGLQIGDLVRGWGYRSERGEFGLELVVVAGAR